MSFLTPALHPLEKSPYPGQAHIRIRRHRAPVLRLRARKREVPPDSMSDKSGHWAGEFAEQRRGRLLARARNLCRNADDAEDLVQETVFRFLLHQKAKAEPPDPRSCEAWMMTTLAHLFFGQCRKRKVQEAGAKEPSLNNELVPPPDLSAEPAYDALTSGEISEALHMLSPKLRETFEMHASGKKYHEIARFFGIPVGTVGKRLADARAKLRELLKKKE
jgi:RNA polymerase sigma factor (sigma-70 family)